MKKSAILTAVLLDLDTAPTAFIAVAVTKSQETLIRPARWVRSAASQTLQFN